MGDLIECLKDLLLTTVQIDKKYRETVPEVISNMRDIVGSDDEGHKKKRKARKMKLGKDALYPLEDDSIRQWWNANKPEIKENESTITAQQVKSHVFLLRARETKLQMILLLEILALEPLKNSEDTADNSLPALPGLPETQEPTQLPPLSKKRNKHNPPVLIDVHADRLTIWQSTASDEQLLLEDSQASQPQLNGQSQQGASSEPLKDFCVDVIIPL